MSPLRSTLRLYLTATVLGAAVGMVSVAFLAAVRLLTHLVWEVLPAHVAWVDDHARLATLVVCAGGGAVVGVVNRGPRAETHAAEGVHDLDGALADADAPAAPPTAGGILRLATLGVVSLGFGGSLGPEAPLIAVVAGLAGRISQVLRLARDEVVQLSVAAAVGGLFGAPLGGAALPVEGGEPQRLAQRVTRVGPSIVAGIAGLWVLLAVLPDGSFHRFHLEADPEDEIGLALLAALLAALLGAGGGWLLHRVLGPAQRLTARLCPPLVLRGVLGGVVLGLCGAVTPLALFSGHHQIQELFDSTGERTALVLVGLALLKLLAVVACLATGWYGGEIFPAAMVGTTLGLAVAEVTGTDAVAAVAVAGLVGSAAVALHRPIAALLVFVFFIPTGTLVAAALGAAVGAGVLRATTPAPAAQEAPAA